jgi:hypothetical protein
MNTVEQEKYVEKTVIVSANKEKAGELKLVNKDKKKKDTQRVADVEINIFIAPSDDEEDEDEEEVNDVSASSVAYAENSVEDFEHVKSPSFPKFSRKSSLAGVPKKMASKPNMGNASTPGLNLRVHDDLKESKEDNYVMREVLCFPLENINTPKKIKFIDLTNEEENIPGQLNFDELPY